jgi:hypothetical protein
MFVSEQYLLANQLKRGSEKYFHCRRLSAAWQIEPSFYCALQSHP